VRKVLLLKKAKLTKRMDNWVLGGSFPRKSKREIREGEGAGSVHGKLVSTREK